MLELDDESKIIKKLLVIKEICSWLQTFCPSNAGGSQEHSSLITNIFYMNVLNNFDKTNGIFTSCYTLDVIRF